MPRPNHEPDRLTTATSRLGRALLKLNAALERVEEREGRIEELLSAWDQSWEHRRTEILRWLSATDDEAQADAARTPPTFNLIRMPVDADEMTSMIEP